MYVELYGSMILLHLLAICFYISVKGVISKHHITYKKLFFEYTLTWIVGVIIFVIYIGLTFQHDFFVIDWTSSIIDVVILSVNFIVIDMIIYFIGKKKYNKVFK